MTQASGNKRHEPRLVFNAAATPRSYLNTNRQYLLCTKAPGAQKDRLPGAKFLLDFLASPCLGPAARKISREKSGQSQQKQAADLAESSLTGLRKWGPKKKKKGDSNSAFLLQNFAERFWIHIQKNGQSFGWFKLLFNEKYLIYWVKSAQTTSKATSLNKLHNFPLRIRSHNDNTISELHSASHVTSPAPDRHGQSVFNPDPCNANQVATPVKRVQDSERRRLNYMRGEANG